MLFVFHAPFKPQTLRSDRDRWVEKIAETKDERFSSLCLCVSEGGCGSLNLVTHKANRETEIEGTDQRRDDRDTLPHALSPTLDVSR